MKIKHSLSLTVLFIIAFQFSLFAQNRFFNYNGENASRPTTGKREIFPQKFGGFTLDIASLKNFLWSLPSESSVTANRNLTPVMEIPMPDGTMAKFHVWESSIMEPGLAAKFPEMKQFNGQGIDDPYATIRFDYNPYTGFHAQILSAVSGRIYIDPFAKGDVSYYMSHNTKNYSRNTEFVCEVQEIGTSSPTANRIEAACLGISMRTYRLALACTGEYAVAVCSPNPPSIPLTAAAMLTSVNRVTGVYEKEVSLRMVLIANNNNLIYLDGTTDPYTNNSGGAMLGENQANIDAVIGTANYDIGHVFSTGGGGIASLNSPCNAGSKARGVTGRGVPIGDAFDIDYVAHEMGHQWGGNHSMAGCGSSPGSTKYEVGSGTTIMAYAGICGAQDIQPNSDPFFHGISFDEISNYISFGGGAACGVATATGNTLPVIDPLSNNGLSIPPNTPFTLNATASDANGDALTYCWEQWDLQGTQNWNAGATASAGNTVPLFKSRIPKANGTRTFPDIAVILANYPANPSATMGGLKGETLSPVARVMNFRLTVRDNRAGGGGVVSSGGAGCQSSAPFVVNVVGTTPFTVTIPNGGESYPGGSIQTITWDNAGTSAAPFNVSTVMISLSTDGGLTYPTIITPSTANDGSEALTIPVGVTASARIRITANGNIFFDISNANFTISAPIAGFSFGSTTAAVVTCPAPANMTVVIPTFSTGGFSNPITLSAIAGVPAGTTVTFSPNPVAPGNSTIANLNPANTLASGTYIVTVQGVASAATNQTTNISFTINPGASPIITTQPSSTSACVGSNAVFNVASTGTYQWQLSTNGGGAWNNIPAANGSTYTASAVTFGMNTYQYRVIVTGPCGSTTSNPATLTVNELPVITLQPSNLAVCSGSSATFNVTAGGTGISYQWEVSTNGGGSYSPISLANTSSYTIASTTVALNNNRYRCVVSGICTPQAISVGAILTVRQLPTVSLAVSPLTTLLPGQSTTLTASPSATTGGTLTTTWLYNGTASSPAITGNTYVVNVERIGTYQVLIQESFVSPALVCANQSAVVTINATVSDKLFIFPSPNDGRFTVSYYNNGGATTKRKIVIVDSRGATVYNREFSISGLYTLLNINLERASRGIYYVLVGDASGIRLADGRVHVR